MFEKNQKIFLGLRIAKINLNDDAFLRYHLSKSLTVLFYSRVISDMRRDVQDIFRQTPHEKQVMMFSATLSKEIRPVCKKFMQDVNISSLPASRHHRQPQLVAQAATWNEKKCWQIWENSIHRGSAVVACQSVIGLQCSFHPYSTGGVGKWLLAGLTSVRWTCCR